MENVNCVKSTKNLENTMRNAYYETKKHTDTMFAFNIYPCTIPLDFSFVPLHWQDGVEVIYVKNGSGEVRVDTELYHAKAGDVFIVLPGHIHGINSIPKERMEYENMFFELDFLGIHNVDLCSRKYLHPIADGDIKIPTYLYPDLAKKVLPYVDDECERMMYEGSVIYDEYPDQLQIRLLCNRVYDKVKRAGIEDEIHLKEVIQILVFHEIFRRRCEHRKFRRKYY